MVKEPQDFEHVRPRITRVVISFALAFLLVRWWCGAMLHQMEDPPIRLIGYNFTAWLYRATGMEDALLAGGVASKIFTGVLLISGSVGVWRPMLRANLFLFWICYLTYAVLFNVGTAVTGYSQAFLTIALIPLWAAPRGRFSDWWSALRYYACFVYGSAFLFKIFRGAFWQWEEGVRTVRSNFASFLYARPEWWWTRLIAGSLQHPWLVNAGFKVFVILQGTFMIGFFTRRFDRFLACSAAVLILATLVFGDANFLEMGAMVFLFLPAGWWKRLY